MILAAKRGWLPQRSWVFVIGTLEWQDKDTFDSFPKEQRRDAALVKFFQSAGVPQEQIRYLHDKEAKHDTILEEMAVFLSRAKAGDMLFFYYCGHGYLLDSGEVCFAAYDAGVEGVPDLKAESILDLIERRFAGDRALLAADCCYSGCLAEFVKERKSRVAYACLCSSSASELSTGNWTFTEALLAGLSGQAFSDNDGSQTITLRELADDIVTDMAVGDEQLAAFIISNGFDPQMVIAPARRKPNANVGRRVEVMAEGEWYRARIIDANGDKLRVHYYGWDAADDDWVTEQDIRAIRFKQYAVGATVEVKWADEWYSASVVQAENGLHYIHYDQYDSQWDEWVASKRIRRPRS